jgi:hypothetical protein
MLGFDLCAEATLGATTLSMFTWPPSSALALTLSSVKLELITTRSTYGFPPSSQ